jgi:NAD(P)-dependent dehydrogenase (short-subunit alcohol dehydrogenase family)
MSVKLKPLERQVVVITGASSGIGLATARMAVERGAKVVLAARGEVALRTEAEKMNAGGRNVASYFVVDTANREEVDALARHAVQTFGRIDTWVNNAAAPLYGEITKTSLEDHRRIFDVNYWGVVHGSLAAVEHMTEGGAIINLGSILSEIPIPLQGPYVASKHAVKGFTDTLRIELKSQNLPIAVSLIKPAAIDTPYPDHARLYIEEAPVTPPPRYAPELVARSILHCAEHETREIYVGGAGRIMVAVQKLLPDFYDWSARNAGYSAQKTSLPASAFPARRDNLYEPKADGSERGRASDGSARETSLYTELQLQSWLSNAVMAAALVGAGLALLQFAPRRAQAALDPRRVTRQLPDPRRLAQKAANYATGRQR